MPRFTRFASGLSVTAVLTTALIACSNGGPTPAPSTTEVAPATTTSGSAVPGSAATEPGAAAGSPVPVGIGSELAHLPGSRTTFMLGARQVQGQDGVPVTVDGAAGAAGLITALDPSGAVAGYGLAVKNAEAIAAQVAFTVSYETTAIALMAPALGTLANDPDVMLLVSALLADTPELASAATALTRESATTPDYLNHLTEPTLATINALFGALERQLRSLADGLNVPASDTPVTGTATRSALRGPVTLMTSTQRAAAPAAARFDDDAACETSTSEIASSPVRVQQDIGLCIVEAAIRDDGDIELSGYNQVPRWAVVADLGPDDSATPRIVGLIPPRTMAIPGSMMLLKDVATDLALGNLTGMVEGVAEAFCSVALFGIVDCEVELGPDFFERIVATFDSYASDESFNMRFTVPSGVIRLGVYSVGGNDDTALPEYAAATVTATWMTYMTVFIMPLVALVYDSLIRDLDMDGIDPTEFEHFASRLYGDGGQELVRLTTYPQDAPIFEQVDFAVRAGISVLLAFRSNPQASRRVVESILGVGFDLEQVSAETVLKLITPLSNIARIVDTSVQVVNVVGNVHELFNELPMYQSSSVLATDANVSDGEAAPQFDFPAYIREAPLNGTLDVMAACFDTADESRFQGLFSDETLVEPGTVQAQAEGTVLTSTFVDVVSATPDEATLAFFCNYTYRFEESNVQLVRYTREGRDAVVAESINVGLTEAPVPDWMWGGSDMASEPTCRTTSVDVATLTDSVIEVTQANTCDGLLAPEPANQVRRTRFTFTTSPLGANPFRASIIHDDGATEIETMVAAADILENVLDRPQLVYGEVPFDQVVFGSEGSFEAYFIGDSLVVAHLTSEVGDDFDAIQDVYGAVTISPSGEVTPGPLVVPPTPHYTLAVEENPEGLHPYLWTLTG